MLPDQSVIRDMVHKGVPFPKAYSEARKALPLAKVLDSKLKNAVRRFLDNAREQGKHAFQARRWVEPVGDEVHVIEVIFAESEIDWGRMKGISVISEGQKLSIINDYIGPEGLGLGGSSRRQEWPEEVAEVVIKLLESAYGEKGRTRAYWLPGAKELVAEPEKPHAPNVEARRLWSGQ
jgi:hypothetical protein